MLKRVLKVWKKILFRNSLDTFVGAEGSTQCFYGEKLWRKTSRQSFNHSNQIHVFKAAPSSMKVQPDRFDVFENSQIINKLGLCDVVLQKIGL